jgi:hypothetical protein
MKLYLNHATSINHLARKQYQEILLQLFKIYQTMKNHPVHELNQDHAVGKEVFLANFYSVDRSCEHRGSKVYTEPVLCNVLLYTEKSSVM